MATFQLTKIGKLDAITLTTPVSRAVFVLSFGGILQSFRVKKKNKWIEIIDAPNTAKDIVANKWYPSAKLVPFPNRINDGRYKVGSRTQQLSKNFPTQKHAIHGFVYNKKWQLRKLKIDGDVLTLNIGVKLNAQKGYAHTLDVNCEYILNSRQLTCTTTITNIATSKKSKAPIGDGWHPYFIASGKNAIISFSPKKALQVDTRMIPTGKLLPVTERNIKLSYNKGFSATQGVLDTCFVLASRRVRLKTKEYVLQLEQDAKYPYLQIFTPPKKHSIALEPMSCWPDAFNNKKGLVVLSPGKMWKGTYAIKIV